jgi:hypothetical protein
MPKKSGGSGPQGPKTKDPDTGQENDAKKEAEILKPETCSGVECDDAAYRFIKGLPCLWCNDVDRAVIELTRCPNEFWTQEKW